MRTHPVRPAAAKAIVRPRADAPMRVAVMSIGLVMAAASVAILAIGWQIGGMLLHMLGQG
ncbi:MAG: hypothetical protein ACXU8U_13005 [Asticcacaulis sp.]